MKTERLLMSPARLEAEAHLKSLSETLKISFDNPFLLMRTGLIAKLFFLQEMYEKIIDLPGSVIEVGSWFGQSSIIFENLRAINEPFNFTRSIVSFDTFNGYVETSGLNISEAEIEKYKVIDDWVNVLNLIQGSHKVINNSATKFINIKGDIFKTLPDYFNNNIEPVALVYYDVATYETLKLTFNTVLPHLIRGGVFVFDDYGHQYEGVNQFITEAGLAKKYKLVHSKFYKSKIFLTIE
ncbi:class I SAM-dependent methyltransferase [Methylophilaceae bacterium]|nr:class I SAM-dependent methyltransferase [Methylophilaceae bacterium]